MIQHHQENRDNALRHLEEAGEFLNRIQEKKEKEIQKWRMKLKNIEERERLLEYYRQKRLYDDRKGKHRKRHDETRKSVWDIDNVLLKHIMDELTDKERDELEKYGVSNTINIIFFDTFVIRSKIEEINPTLRKSHLFRDLLIKDLRLH